MLNNLEVWLPSHPKFETPFEFGYIPIQNLELFLAHRSSFECHKIGEDFHFPPHPLHIFSPQVVQNEKRELSDYLLLSLVMSSFLISEKTMRCSIIWRRYRNRRI